MSEIEFVVAIPARMAATRLPDKPLRLIGGIPMVVHVAHQASQAGAREVVVAVDDARIYSAVTEAGFKAVMTRVDHASGTDRLAECAALSGWADNEIVVNVQGDEPFAPPEGIRAVAELLARTGFDMATLATPITHEAEVFDPNVVKVVASDTDAAMYFSRAPIPWQRGQFDTQQIDLSQDAWLRHIGIYAYRVSFLNRFAAMPASRLEQLESLEQLRVLQAGHAIAVTRTPVAFPPGVDTEADLQRAEVHFQKMHRL
jgi:3-deoxy-manno-octulosonate cytidylyltransferase (CMP-KDO synthetase)